MARTDYDAGCSMGKARRRLGLRRSLGSLLTTFAMLAASGLTASTGSATVMGAASARDGWQRQVAPGDRGSFFTGVSCATPTTCVAVGSQSFTTHQGALAYSWTGGIWHKDVAAQPPGETNTGLESVSCPTPSPGPRAGLPTCVAVGYSGIDSETARPFLEILKGSTWKVVTVPGLAGKVAELLSVSCWSSNGCFAVGLLEKVNGGDAGAITAVFNGTSWVIVKTPSAVPTDSALDGVSCLAATIPPLCKAVGTKTVNHITTPLLELANSTHGWTVAPVPGVAGSTATALTSVACTAPDSCIAVGSTSSPTGGGAFSEVDNSGQWKVVIPPRLATPGNGAFGSVACTQFLDGCQAVGIVATAASVPLIEQFNGTSWSVEPTSPPSSLSSLSGVACAMPASAQGDQLPCTAVGEYSPKPQAGDYLLVLHR